MFETSIKAFAPRNFGHGALHNDIGGWHLQLRACRHFHPEVYDPAWLLELAALQRQLGEDTVAGLREIVAHVTSRPPREDQALARDLGLRLRAVEREILAAWTGLSRRMFAATESLKRRRDTIGHDATPLQDAAPELLHA